MTTATQTTSYKTCSRCHGTLQATTDNFRWLPGRALFDTYCLDCRRDYNREHRAANRATRRANQATRRFGVEVEFKGSKYNAEQELNRAGITAHQEGYGHSTPVNWKLVDDGSLSGYENGELVSPVLTTTEDLRKVGKALSAAGVRTDKECGLHVHIDARDLTLEQYLNVVRLYAANETLIDTMIAKSRRGSNASYARTNIGQDLSGYAHLSDLPGAGQSNSRYRKVNITAYSRHQTIEFRQHQGTISGAKIEAWVNFLQGLVAQAIAGNTTAYATRDEMLDAFGQGSAKAYWTQRANTLQGQASTYGSW